MDNKVIPFPLDVRQDNRPDDDEHLSPQMSHWMDILATLTCERRGLQVAEIAEVEVYNCRLATGCTATTNFVVCTQDGRRFHLQYATGAQEIAINVNPLPPGGRFPFAPVHEDPTTHWKRNTEEFEDAVAMVCESARETDASGGA